MRILTLVPSSRQAQVEGLLLGDSFSTRARSLTEVANALTREAFDLVIMEIDQVREDRLVEVARGLSSSDATVVLLTLMQNGMTTAALALSEATPVEIVARRIGDEVSALRRVLKVRHHPSAAALLLHQTTALIRRLPSAIRTPTVDLFTLGFPPLSLETFVQATGRHLRTVERSVRDAGFIGLHRLVYGIGLSRTWEMLAHDEAGLARLAEACRCSTRTISERYRTLCGLSPRHARVKLSTVEFVERLRHEMCA